MKTLFVMILAPLVLAACAGPARHPAATPAPPAALAGEQATPLPHVTVQAVSTAKHGRILADAKRMTLYRYAIDAPNSSNCYDQCAQQWPPLLFTAGAAYLAGGVAGKLDTITRADGGRQITYEGTPLYYWAKDVKPGDTTGQGVGNIWFVVQPAAAPGAGRAP